MSSNAVQDQTGWPDHHQGEITLINVFTPKPGYLDDFIDAQVAEFHRLKGSVAGWTGNKLYRSLDGRLAVNVATFKCLSDYRTWRGSDVFRDHLERISHLIDTAAPGLYELACSVTPHDGEVR